MQRIVGVASATLACAVLAGSGLAGCGPGGARDGSTKRFESEGFGITFDYPVALTEVGLRDDASSPPGVGAAPGRPDDVVRELTLTDDDFIAVRRDPMDPALLTSPSARLEPEVDQLAKVLDPTVGPGRPITVGGMPGFEYLDAGPDAQHRFLFLAGPGSLYLVHCKSTPAHRAEIADACATVERTLHRV